MIRAGCELEMRQGERFQFDGRAGVGFYSVAREFLCSMSIGRRRERNCNRRRVTRQEVVMQRVRSTARRGEGRKFFGRR